MLNILKYICNILKFWIYYFFIFETMNISHISKYFNAIFIYNLRIKLNPTEKIDELELLYFPYQYNNEFTFYININIEKNIIEIIILDNYNCKPINNEMKIYSLDKINKKTILYLTKKNRIIKKPVLIDNHFSAILNIIKNEKPLYITFISQDIILKFQNSNEMTKIFFALHRINNSKFRGIQKMMNPNMNHNSIIDKIIDIEDYESILIYNKYLKKNKNKTINKE